MLVNLTQFVIMKKGLRKNFALNYLEKNGFVVNQNNLKKILTANNKESFPHVDLFTASRYLTDMSQNDFREQIVKQTYNMLSDLESEVVVKVPKDLERDS